MSRVVKRVSRGCQEGVKSCEEVVKSCQEGGMTRRVTVSRRCQELSRVCQDCVTKEHGRGAAGASRIQDDLSS